MGKFLVTKQFILTLSMILSGYREVFSDKTIYCYIINYIIWISVP